MSQIDEKKVRELKDKVKRKTEGIRKILGEDEYEKLFIPSCLMWVDQEGKLIERLYDKTFDLPLSEKKEWEAALLAFFINYPLKELLDIIGSFGKKMPHLPHPLIPVLIAKWDPLFLYAKCYQLREFIERNTEGSIKEIYERFSSHMKLYEKYGVDSFMIEDIFSSKFRSELLFMGAEGFRKCVGKKPEDFSPYEEGLLRFYEENVEVYEPFFQFCFGIMAYKMVREKELRKAYLGK